MTLAESTLGRIGPYRVARELGSDSDPPKYLASEENASGASGEVVLCVAPASRVADRQAAAARAREAQAYLQLNHPGVARLKRVFPHENTWVAAFEHVPGISLQDLLSQPGTRLEDEAVLYMGAILTEALAWVHAQRSETGKALAHGKIERQFILLQEDGRVRLTGLGIGTLLGTAPAGRGSAADAEQVARILWELLSRRTWEGPDGPPLGSLRSDLPIDVSGAIDAATGYGSVPIPCGELASILRSGADLDAGRARLRDAVQAAVSARDGTSQRKPREKSASNADFDAALESLSPWEPVAAKPALETQEGLTERDSGLQWDADEETVVSKVRLKDEPDAAPSLDGPALAESDADAVAPPSSKPGDAAQPTALSDLPHPSSAPPSQPDLPPALLASTSAPPSQPGLPPAPTAPPSKPGLPPPPVPSSRPASKPSLPPPPVPSSRPASKPSLPSPLVPSSAPPSKPGLPSPLVPSSRPASKPDLTLPPSVASESTSKVSLPHLPASLSALSAGAPPPAIAPDWASASQGSPLPLPRSTETKPFEPVVQGAPPPFAALLSDRGLFGFELRNRKSRRIAILVGALALGGALFLAIADRENSDHPKGATASAVSSASIASSSPPATADPAQSAATAVTPAPTASVVTPSESAAAAPLPIVSSKEAQAPSTGLLTVHSPASSAHVFVNGAHVGRVETQLTVPCGKRFVAIGTRARKEKPTVWLAPGRNVDIVCGSTTEVTLRPTPQLQR